MESLIQTYLPNVYKMGWAGQAGWGTAIYLTLYMTVLSFIIGGFLGLVAGLFLVLTAPGGVLENKVVFWILDKITSIFRAVPFIILLAILSPLSHLIVKTSIGPNAALVPLSLQSLPSLPVRCRLSWLNWMAVSLRRLKRAERLSGTSWVFTYQKVFQI